MENWLRGVNKAGTYNGIGSGRCRPAARSFREFLQRKVIIICYSNYGNNLVDFYAFRRTSCSTSSLLALCKPSYPMFLLPHPLHLCTISQPTQLQDHLLKESQITDGLFVEVPPNGLLSRQDDGNLERFRLATPSSMFMQITVLGVQNLPSQLRWDYPLFWIGGLLGITRE